MNDNPNAVQVVTIPGFRWIGQRAIFRQQSPLFRFTKTDLAAASVFNIILKQTPYRKYFPFNFLQVSNQTDKSMTVMTETMTKTIESNTIQSFDSESLPAFRKIEIHNLTGANATGDMEILVQRVMSYKDLLRDRLLRGGQL